MERFKLDPATTPTAWRIGRVMPNGDVEPCFTLRHREDGGISITDVVGTITDEEKRWLLAQFGRLTPCLTGGERDGRMVSVSQEEPPGSLEQFTAVVYALSRPFTKMGRAS